MRAEAQLEIASIDRPDISIAILKAPIDISMRELKRFTAQVAGVDYDENRDSILIYTANFLANRPSLSLLEHLTPAKREKVYFSLIADTSEDELLLLQKNRPYEVHFSADAYSVDLARLVFANEHPTFAGLFDGLKKSVHGFDFGPGPFRFVIISNSKIEEVTSVDREIIQKVDAIRIETEPLDQRALSDNQVLVQVTTKRGGDGQIPHSPFLVLAGRGEPFRNVRERIKRAMHSPQHFEFFLFSMKVSKVSLAFPLTDDSMMRPEISLRSEIRIEMPARSRLL
jgi:hypothetical protein